MPKVKKTDAAPEHSAPAASPTPKKPGRKPTPPASLPAQPEQAATARRQKPAKSAAPEAVLSSPRKPRAARSAAAPATQPEQKEVTIPPTRKTKKAAPQAEPVHAPAEAAPVKPRRGRPARAQAEAPVPAVVAEPEVKPAAKKTARKAAKPAPAKAAAVRPTPETTAGRKKVSRTEAPAKPSDDQKAKPARSGRGKKAAQTQPVPTPPETGAEEAPLILEVPKRRGAGRKRGLSASPLPEVLSGVEAVPVAEPQPGAPSAAEETGDAQGVQVVTRAHVRPLVDMPAHDDDFQPAPTPARRGRKARGAEAQGVGERGVGEQGDGRPAPTPGAAEEPAQPEHPARDLVLAQLRKLGRPVHVRDLERTFTRQMLDRLGDWRDLGRLLESLTESGEVIRTRKKTYGLPEAMSLVRGRFQASAAGFGFVIPDSGGEDFYIPADQTLEAWNGDIVLVRMEGRGDTARAPGRRGQRGDGNPRASVVRFVQRAYRQLVGTLEFHHGHPILKPDDHRARHRILLLPEGLEGLQAGARVVAELFWPETTGEDEVFAQVTRTLGAEDDPVTETEAVIVKFGLRGEFPDEVLAQANAIPAEIPASALRGRLDLRSFNIFTVDGRDAKDFDDAIHIQPTPEGTFVVGVHIADVSHYVQEGTPLDEEAYARATSVYLPGRVLPMLPEHLSNGVCSLVPYQDRLTMTALIELSAEGEILKVQLAPSIINSKARLTYDEVQAYSEATATLPEAARPLEGDLHLLLKITSKLRQKRLREGSLDFKLREVKVDVGPDGKMELIPIREETARGMIEDLMLLANKVVARYLLEREIPALFRIHEEPTLQRFQEVTGAIGRLGFAFPGGEPTPQAYQAVLKQVRGTGRESVVNTLLLRSMQQAKYAGENLGHFGLAFAEYLHFTSPIRRYPDLLVHRVLRGVLAGELRAGGREVAELQGRLPGMGEHTSDRERAAAEAERDLTKYYQAKWAQEHLGESFHGNVSGVVASGLYVALDNGVEGKLHISHLDDDYYVFIEDAQMLRGRSRGRSFRLGDPLQITIQTVRPLARQIDLTLADPTDPAYRPGDIHQEKDMDSPVKPRARRREEREQEHREKLRAVQVSAPKKFTLDDPQPRTALSPAPARTGGRGRGAPNGRGQGPQPRTFGGVPVDSAVTQRPSEPSAQDRSGQGGRGARRVITLERPRNEHLRPVNITVQRMYFGDWTLENMPPEEGQGGPRPGRERGYDRPERGGRGYSRGGNDRGAVRSVNGRAGGPAQPSPRPAPAPAQAAPVKTSAVAAPEDASKRRRRRRGRRPGGGGNEG